MSNLLNSTAMIEATKAMISSDADKKEAAKEAATCIYTATVHLIAFLLDYRNNNEKDNFNNKAVDAFVAVCEESGIELKNGKASKYIASFKRIRIVAKASKVRKIINDCKSTEAIIAELKEAGLTSFAKLEALAKPELAKLSAEAKAAVAAMLATTEVQTFVADLDEDQIAAFARSLENSCRNVDAVQKSNDKKAKAEAKAELKRRMKADAEDEAAIAS